MQQIQPPLQCHPDEIRDILKSLPNHRAARKKKPNPLTSYQRLPFLTHHKTCSPLSASGQQHPISVGASMHNLGGNPCHDAPERTALSKYRPISLMTQIQKVYTTWILAQCGQAIDHQIDETQSGFRRHRQAAETR